MKCGDEISSCSGNAQRVWTAGVLAPSFILIKDVLDAAMGCVVIMEPSGEVIPFY